MSRKIPLHELPAAVKAAVAAKRPELAPHLGLDPANPPPPDRRSFCVYEGPVVEACKTCRGGDRDVRVCAHPAPSDPDRDTCTRGVVSDRVQACARCQDRRTVYDPDSLVARFDQHNLSPAVPGRRFNPSLLAHGTGYLLAYRTGWAGSDVRLARLDADLRPTGEDVRLALDHPAAAFGREDPRLFLFAGRVHVAFTGVLARPLRTNQLYARLRDDLSVERVYAPHLTGRHSWEKNWQFFDHDGELLCVYRPHHLLRVDGENCQRLPAPPGVLSWAGGEPRGGCPPVRVGNEYWHWFHDRVPLPDGHLAYRTGVYAFAAEPPFGVLRVTARPLLTAERRSQPQEDPNYASVEFCGGAVRSGPWWLVSHGTHDRWATVHRFAHAEVEDRLRPAAG